MNNSLLKLSAHVEPDGNIADIKDTHTNDSINEGNYSQTIIHYLNVKTSQYTLTSCNITCLSILEQLRNNVAQNTASSNDQNEKKKKKKRKKEKGSFQS